MLLSTAVGIFLIAWCSIFLIDYSLRVRNYEPYMRFVAKFGVEVSPFQLRVYFPCDLQSFENELLKGDEATKSDVLLTKQRRGCRGLLMRIWFGMGAIVSLLCLVGISAYMCNILQKDVSQLMSSRPRIHNTYRGMEYRYQEEFQTTTNVPTTVKDNFDAPVEHVLSSDDDYDLIDDGQRHDGGLMPIIPGFNLPWSHIPIFMIVLIVSAIVHELGHAWAAAINGVKVNGFGIFLFGLYPGAFTDIEPLSLQRTTSFRKLQIFGAGIWHNIILSILAVGLFNSASLVMSPLLVEGHGVSVKDIDARSGLSGGNAGLLPGDVVESVNECRVETIQDWMKCIKQMKLRRDGRCMAKSEVYEAMTMNTWTSNDEVHCCDEFNVTNAHVCFEYAGKEGKEETKAPQLNSLLGIARNRLEKDTKDGMKSESIKSNGSKPQYSCLNARYVVEQSSCNETNPCQKSNDEENVCVYPALFNGTRLVRIGLSNRAKPVLFVGQLNEMLSMVAIDAHTSRFSFVEVAWLEHFKLASKYLFTLSLALGLLNAMPCYSLDGQFIVTTLLKYTTSSYRRRSLIRYLILCCGTGILGLNVFSGFLKILILS